MENQKTSKGYYYPSEREDVIEALQAYCLGKAFLDIGAGDNRVPEWARECGAINPRGIEFEDFATDIRGDLFEHDIMQYDVLFYYALGADLEIDLLNWIKRKFNGILLFNQGVVWNEHCRDSILEKEPISILGKTKVFDFRNI